MSILWGFVLAYLLGGLTFIPLLITLVLCHAHWAFPHRDAEELSKSKEQEAQKANEKSKAHGDTATAIVNLPHELQPRIHEPDVAAGYFAVSREYSPNGLSGKPPERTAQPGDAIASESPSVYQSMYRSIFDRNKSQSPALEGRNSSKSDVRMQKKVGSVFYIVLRFAATSSRPDIF